MKNDVLYMFRGAKKRAKKLNIPFSIIPEDINIPPLCPVFKFPLKRNFGGKGPTNASPSLDRIIPEMGYTKENIQVISNLANKMKSNANKKQLYLFADWINKTRIEKKKNKS